MTNGVAPKIMSQVFPLKECVKYRSRNIFATRNVRTVRYDTETLAHLGPKIWALVPNDMKKENALKFFRNKIRMWKPDNCTCKLWKITSVELGI